MSFTASPISQKVRTLGIELEQLWDAERQQWCKKVFVMQEEHLELRKAHDAAKRQIEVLLAEISHLNQEVKSLKRTQKRTRSKSDGDVSSVVAELSKQNGTTEDTAALGSPYITPPSSRASSSTSIATSPSVPEADDDAWNKEKMQLEFVALCGLFVKEPTRMEAEAQLAAASNKFLAEFVVYLAYVGQIDILRKVIQRCFWRYIQQQTKQNCLVAGAQTGQTKIVHLLLDFGADVNALDPEGNTALHEACARNDIRLTELLLAHGASQSLENKKGETARFIALSKGPSPVLQALNEQRVVELSYVGNVLYRSKDYQSALDQYTQALQVCPDLPAESRAKLLYNKARVLFRLGKTKSCIEECTNAIAVDPTYKNAYIQRAESHMELLQFELAIQDYQHLMQIDKTNQWHLKAQQAEKMKNVPAHVVLGIDQHSSEQEVKRAYKMLAAKWNPDKHQSSESQQTRAVNHCKQLKQAYDTMLATLKKQVYVYDEEEDASSSDSGSSSDDEGSATPPPAASPVKSSPVSVKEQPVLYEPSPLRNKRALPGGEVMTTQCKKCGLLGHMSSECDKIHEYIKARLGTPSRTSPCQVLSPDQALNETTCVHSTKTEFPEISSVGTSTSQSPLTLSSCSSVKSTPLVKPTPLTMVGLQQLDPVVSAYLSERKLESSTGSSPSPFASSPIPERLTKARASH
eukprot:GILJ01003084.1.p1 GENE.GILJ01003084.1~~GILJ01003084.1.p1  ORF type:complete len:691 (-),score=97.76 GILJ01003084.1:137-2209(-)